MRLTTIFLFAGALHLAAAGRAQSVSLSVKDAALEDCFRSIQEQTGYSFIYTRNLLGDSRKVTLSLHGETLATALDRLFQNQPLTYTLVDKYIVVKRRPAVGLPPPAGAVSPPNDIRGRVVDSTGAPIAGASVLVKGTQRGAATDAKGEFVIKGVEGGVTLVVTYTGFEPRQYKYSGQAGVTILLERSTSPLDQIQVIAYGTTTQRFSTGNISTVKAADIEKQPVNNPLLALEGRVPGLFITQSNGLPGAGVTVRVEGQNSIASGNDPLYVIDGVPYVSQLLSTTEGGGTAGVLGSSGATGLGGNPLSYINSADIESIEVLKDADATAIYGSRAANGAILITTKKGKAGRTEVSLNAQTGWGKVTRHVKLLNTTQYLEMRHEAKRNDNTAILSTDYDMNGLWDTTRNTDWQKALIGGTAKYTQTNASVSGGTALAQYFLGGTYYRETAVFPGNFSDQKASLHFSESSASVNNKFHLQFSGNYMLDDNALPGADLTNVALQLAPDAPALYNTDGSLNWAPNAAGTSTWTNPLATLFNQYTNKTRNLISNLSLAYSILRGLDLKCSLGYTDLHTDETVLYPLTTLAPESRPNSTRSTIFTASNIGSWIAEPQAVYRTNIAHGKLEFLSGLTIQQNDNNGQWLQAKGFTSDDVMKDIKSAAAVTVNSTVVSAYKYEALFG
ncbi:MAG TPA: SusC/RagA family TonB-linked outer membrane protein, partial [Puia sp.]|nr:SusC/RagA family TonB-linked outer membrane protein [Puia sp.]